MSPRFAGMARRSAILGAVAGLLGLAGCLVVEDDDDHYHYHRRRRGRRRRYRYYDDD